ncbi:response regulator transcription factor [Paenibacillus sp. FSL H7-0942]|uniref:response regulator transcription factor n=1 Tax=Paenibacillus TaxID=44249 RepID=UPI0003E260DF|nr:MULTISPECIES: response regulator transcription factor [Paenibacillus]ETT35100.1 transcriptional regulator [Paenibacillus sp. FSL R5-192]KLU57888.1 transcriptional regulator [Paenibacillus sp. VT-400]OMF02824.1 DNA-binding response regulator [Paenibacillus amylolyticus]OMF43807.1 DNA-binding response regulator [Paenibacillus amylolyticus]PKQ92000.1 DNA-binding response regulator [Paenibacillus sp. BGI2013]
MDTHKIMIVDDDPHICEIVQVYCDREGFVSTCSHSGSEAMELLASFEPDLIILDILLANENGIDWCRNARNLTSAPIVFLSSQEEDEIKISALSYGGDDYVTKPFSPGVLMAKIKAHLRRVSTGRREQLLELPGLTLDFYTQSVNMGSTSISLSKKEFSLLSYMAQNVNRVVSVDTLFQIIWGMESLEDTRTVAVHISNLRKKIESDPADPERIITVRGSGYMLVSNSTSQA